MGHASLFVVNCFRISIFAVAKTMFVVLVGKEEQL